MIQTYIPARLLATLWTDVRLQLRNGFYYAALFVVVLIALLATQVGAIDMGWLLPAFILSNLVINTYYFIGGLVLLEKREGTLEAQVVTPLRREEYLFSKVITLALLSILENSLITLLLYGWRINWLALLAGILSAAAFFCMAGFVLVARYDSINEYIFPSVFYTFLLELPLLPYLGLGESWLYYLHPLQPALLFLQGAFQNLEAWQVLYALLYGGASIAAAFWLAKRAFYRFVVAKEGVK